MSVNNEDQPPSATINAIPNLLIKNILLSVELISFIELNLIASFFVSSIIHGAKPITTNKIVKPTMLDNLFTKNNNPKIGEKLITYTRY